MAELKELISYIDPDESYDIWIAVGAALKHEGESLDTFEDWSARGSKYRAGECQKKWASFNENTASIVTGGTIYHLARERGFMPSYSDDNDFDVHNLLLDEAIIDPAFVSVEKVPQPAPNYNAKGEMLEYLKTLFQPDDYVGYCVKFTEVDGRFKPTGTQYRRTARDIISKLESGTIEYALGTLNPDAGAYVRFNPLDGAGENNANVTRWKYCLIESDEDSLERQYSLLKAMNLPIEFIIASGGKSLHAITRVDAENAQQYRQRVQEIYSFCRKSGLTPDEQDKNESRFSRLPGVKRMGKWQYIVARQIGAPSYDAWIEWRQEQADDLPADTNLAEIWNKIPPLKEELIPNVLRVGHKMLLAGPSKAGKSFLLMNLAISMAEGVEWLGFKCKQGKVCYVNLELDAVSCFHRFRDIYTRRGLKPEHLNNIDVWNLRGHAVSMDRLAPVLIHRFKGKNYIAVIIDPIYKVLGNLDENAAGDMARFCNEFDRIATEMDVATIYCHHHSKGASGKYANAADRSSGSGVFARDPDAILDLTELDVSEVEDKYRAQVPDACEAVTGWELSGTLREFPPLPVKRLWFDYPYHRPDEWNFLADVNVQGQKKKKDKVSLEEAFALSELGRGAVKFDDLMAAIGLKEKTLSNLLPKSEFESAPIITPDGRREKLVIRRSTNEFTWNGTKYDRDHMQPVPRLWKPVE